MILAGDVGGTKCNLALFSEKDGKITPVFRQRFASKEFAKFELIVNEFSRQAEPHLHGQRIAAANARTVAIDCVDEGPGRWAAKTQYPGGIH